MASKSHISSYLPIKDIAIPVDDDAHYFPFDHHLASTKLLYPEGWDNHTVTDYGLYTGTNLCATLRNGGGRFGGAVAIEESTENILYSNQSFSLPFSGLTCSVSRTAIEENRRWRVVTGDLIGSHSFGSFRLNLPLDKLVNGETYCVSYKYRDINGNSEFSPGDLGDNVFADQVREIDYGRYKYVYAWQSRSEYTSVFRFIDFYMKPHSEIEIWDVQVEQKAFPTSFVDGSRPTGRLVYNNLPEKNITVNFWWKSPYILDLGTGDQYGCPAIMQLGPYSTSDRSLRLWLWNSELKYYIGHPDSGGWMANNTISTSSPIVPNHFYMITIALENGKNLKFYVDGELGHERVLPLDLDSWGTNRLAIEPSSSAHNNAMYDELMIVSHALPPEEIRAIYHSQRPLYDPNRIDHTVG